MESEDKAAPGSCALSHFLKDLNSNKNMVSEREARKDEVCQVTVLHRDAQINLL